MRKNSTGDNESFYSYILFKYYLKLDNKLLDKYQLEVGIFILQGIE